MKRLLVMLTLLGVALGGVVAGGKAQAQVVTADPVLAAAGDIAQCASQNDEATATLLGNIGGTVAALGDNVYPHGTAAEYQNCYDPSWGAYKNQTRPAIGNHEYDTIGASGYFGYFGTAAGDSAKGYYSYNLGDWHVVVLNSNCSQVGGCGKGSAQEQWLKADLAANPNSCTLAYWHAPRYSSKQTGTPMAPFWNDLYSAGAEVVLNGHQHNYERFAPQTPGGVADPDRGIREFVAGMGGGTLRGFTSVRANSEVRNSSTYGVLKLTLHSDSYDWEFVPVAGRSFTDSGSGRCH